MTIRFVIIFVCIITLGIGIITFDNVSKEIEESGWDNNQSFNETIICSGWDECLNSTEGNWVISSNAWKWHFKNEWKKPLWKFRGLIHGYTVPNPLILIPVIIITSILLVLGNYSSRGEF
jgi:hypothetical protein